ncbi:MAG: CRISPR-associated endonuclease Cas2 [Spirochaetales bacterium]|nr:CRISPR-associated endonuclease Cas2 [Spirochaetales bacterium]
MIVFFDLPVVEKEDRKAASDFRNYLLDEGFSMGQFSVYYRLLSGKEAAESMVTRIKKQLPRDGKVDIVTITDKQYENMISFSGRELHKKKKTYQQYLQF